MSKQGYWNDRLFIDKITQSLKKNNIVAGTSDTVLGLLAPLTRNAKEALDVIKGRERKPYLVLVASIEKAMQFSDSFSDSAIKKLTDTYWPGPLTLVLPAKKNIPDFICSPEHTIAIRVPDHPGLQQLLSNFDGLFSTSANLSNQQVADSLANLDPKIKERVDLLVDDQEKKLNPPSTIVAYNNGTLTVLRQGAIKI